MFMAKSPMDTLHFACIQIVIALLLFTHAKSTIEGSTSALHPNDAIPSCVAGEKSALLAFRAGLSDPANLLSSWKGDDCCRWKGVYCSNRTGHVVRLDLHGNGQALAGNISSSLLGLHHLRYLDLSHNRFDKVHIPEFIGSINNLRYLDLSGSLFIGRIPPQLGNLSNLRYLNLGYISDTTYSTDITWLSRLTSLEHLDMSGLNLSTLVHWLPSVNMLPTLKVLRVTNCLLKNSPDSLLLSSNDFYGPFPDGIGNMTSIVELDLSDNNLVGMIPSNMKNLCKLESLVSFRNNISGSIAELLHRLPNCSPNKLQDLSLSDNNLTGSLPTTLVEPLRNLNQLDLSDNKLTGHVPVWIGELKQLTNLDLSSKQPGRGHT
ncbi:hypothetical protein CFC21_091194 [Triticum aestivum]|uniref:Uncharacterized protein n=2 Tax=Triticum aestivum TaxID=4565 RepID=A0A3B6QBP2_WHEAT|nr:hypothetical protein CFC21_091194 [Triticum aestivum]